MIVSLMVPARSAVEYILALVEEDRRRRVELNFRLPDGMSERGMGVCVGQGRNISRWVTAWFRPNTRMPVIVELTPNVAGIASPRRREGGPALDAVSLITR